MRRSKSVRRSVRKNVKRNVKRSVRKNVKKNTRRNQRRVNRRSSKKRVSRRSNRKKINKVRRKRKNKRNTLKGGEPKLPQMPDWSPIKWREARIGENRIQRKREETYMLRVVTDGWERRPVGEPKKREVLTLTYNMPVNYSTRETSPYDITPNGASLPTVYLSAEEMAEEMAESEYYEQKLKEWSPIYFYVNSSAERDLGLVSTDIKTGQRISQGYRVDSNVFMRYVRNGVINDDTLVYSPAQTFPYKWITWGYLKSTLKRNIKNSDTLYAEIGYNHESDIRSYRYLQWWTTKVERRGGWAGIKQTVWDEPVDSEELVAIYKPDNSTPYMTYECKDFRRERLTIPELESLKFYPKFTTNAVLGKDKDRLHSPQVLQAEVDTICPEWVDYGFCPYGRGCPCKHPPKYSREYKEEKNRVAQNTKVQEIKAAEQKAEQAGEHIGCAWGMDRKFSKLVRVVKTVDKAKTRFLNLTKVVPEESEKYRTAPQSLEVTDFSGEDEDDDEDDSEAGNSAEEVTLIPGAV